MEISIPTLREIEEVVEKCLAKHFSSDSSLNGNQRCKEPLQNRIVIKEAIEITSLKKATIYKLTMKGTIPHEKFRNGRLVFSRKELTLWMEQQTIRKQSPEEIATAHLAKEARKKI
jgi:excisionase family DNA binding protein